MNITNEKLKQTISELKRMLPNTRITLEPVPDGKSERVKVTIYETRFHGLLRGPQRKDLSPIWVDDTVVDANGTIDSESITIISASSNRSNNLQSILRDPSIYFGYRISCWGEGSGSIRG